MSTGELIIRRGYTSMPFSDDPPMNQEKITLHESMLDDWEEKVLLKGLVKFR